MKKIISTYIIVLLSLNGIAQHNYAIKQQFSIKSGGGWDYLYANPVGNQLYVSHGTQVNILDKNTGDSLGVIENTNGVHGIVTIPQLNKGFTSNGLTNNVSVFDITTNKVLSQIKTGEKPDAIFYETLSKTIIVCNGKSNDISVIDPFKEVVIATIPVGGKPETAVSDELGKVYVNIENKSEIVQIDLQKQIITNHFSLTPAEEPTGLAIDTKLHLLFAGAEEKLAIVNYQSGKLIKTIKIGEGCDGVAYDQKNKILFTANGSGSISIIKGNQKGAFQLMQTLITPKGARTICIDPSTNKIYTPTAELEKQMPGATGRPKSIPGTMKVLVVE